MNKIIKENGKWSIKDLPLTEKENERYTYYKKVAKKPTNWDFMDFIAQMKTLYNKSIGKSKDHAIEKQDEFTDFISKNYKKFKLR